MKKLCSILLAGLGMMMCPLNFTVSAENVNQEVIAEAQKFDDNNVQEKKKSETVYITQNGKCYHKENCSCLKKSKIAISKDDAEKSNYTNCSKCFKSEKKKLDERSKLCIITNILWISL